MKANLTVILSVAGVAALLASPAAAAPVCLTNQPCHPHVVYLPDANVHVAPTHAARSEAYVAPHGSTFGNTPGINGVGPYTPAIPSPRYGDSGDFQTDESR
jgi:hypothetical protein